MSNWHVVHVKSGRAPRFVLDCYWAIDATRKMYSTGRIKVRFVRETGCMCYKFKNPSAAMYFKLQVAEHLA